MNTTNLGTLRKSLKGRTYQFTVYNKKNIIILKIDLNGTKKETN